MLEEASTTVNDQVDSVVRTEPSITAEPLQTPLNNSNGTQNRTGNMSRVSDQSRNGQNVDEGREKCS